MCASAITYPPHTTPATLRAWNANLALSTKLKQEDRNGIWAYVLKEPSPPVGFGKAQV
jgi:hypothetical protein